MEPITQQDLQVMIELQSTETEIDSLEAALELLPARAAELENELAEVSAHVEAKKAALSELNKKYRAFEAEVEANQARIKKRNGQLGSVKTNKDYQAILKEIEEIKAASIRMEDEMLQYLDDIEAAGMESSEAEKLLAAKKELIESQKLTIEQEGVGHNEKLARLRDRSGELSDKLDPKIKKRYYNIKSRSGGIAIVSVSDAICKGCHLNIPPQLYNELHRENEVRLCPHCYRMIYVL